MISMISSWKIWKEGGEDEPPKMGSGWRLGLRSTILLIKAFPNREVMIPRWKQIIVCLKVIWKGLFEVKK
jgi:hypothetical protein